jgi:hypothetical protein
MLYFLKKTNETRIMRLSASSADNVPEYQQIVKDKQDVKLTWRLHPTWQSGAYHCPITFPHFRIVRPEP